jgi:outer membrane protein OmpA-like peptidoglycan-associated protein
MRAHLFHALLLVSTGASASAAVSAETNLLALAAGALPVVEPPSYGSWPAVQLLDDAPGSGWAGNDGTTGGQAFVFELADPATLERFEFDTSCIDGDGRGAKGVRVAVSATSRDAGFEPVAEASLADREDGQKVPATRRIEGRWVRLEIVGNHGDAQWVELCSFRGFGKRPAPPPIADVSGTYTTDYGDFHVRAQGSALRGCYEHDAGLLSGSIEGRVMRITWQENGGPHDNGPAILVFGADGKAFRGLWWNATDRDSRPAGEWKGAKKSAAVGSCPHWSGSVGGEIERELAATGRARVYGIEFDVDSATLRVESRAVLDDVARALAEHPDWKLSVEGHTDASGAAAHNQDLSERRAAAVVAYLSAHGAGAQRLTSAGFGATRAVADNATELGRARNRRVEIVRTGG